MTEAGESARTIRTGWASFLAKLALLTLLFEAVTGLAITFGPFHPAVEWGVLMHTLFGVLLLLPIAWYLALHWDDYKHYALSHVVLLSTLPHLAIVLLRVRRPDVRRAAAGYLAQAGGLTLLGIAGVAMLPLLYSGTKYDNAFPADYAYLYGADRPFAPSLARTSTGGALDARALAGSESCGTSGCHEQILAEWKPSAHHWAAMDAAFQKIQTIMAQQNGAESTRYCGGCHDPISLFSGTKNIGVENLTALQGYREGVSCLACHAIRETDLQGNANYVVSQPAEYLWQWSDAGPRRVLRDFLIRTYPDQHATLSKRAYKAPEYCAACHKQFIDQDVNRVGWVQLQNQYDNWKASHWNVPGDPRKTVECRECHMPLTASHDPAAGDTADYNRRADDGMHRSHRFVASNGMMPAVLEVEGWEEQVRLTEKWLQGKVEIPEIASKWASGPIVRVGLEVPEQVRAGDDLDVRVVLSSSKVGHDFPTGPLDIIQSWIELHVTDDAGNTVFASGRRDEKNFIEPGSFLFKVEPVDQYGNLIDRHNLWEMVGVRFRRALFPGYSDSVDFSVACPAELPPASKAPPGSRERSVKDYAVSAEEGTGSYHVTAILNYRKVDQFLLNYMFGENAGLTAPVVEIDRATADVRVVGAGAPRAGTVRVGG